ncbi:SRPBCC domain-containing protein [Paeniglutamicibacter terrestris]|uniref:SRPBCC family protein n=1 Tax=Paeniglutamicibacter terrestris TaxID=2723403 RepID=A0ABX1G892_9MICC|nr:SRPBCC domain-containing protein [Paeniglutamicibacter terrestris]NKG22480.1 hypothetical protein [Paeniglutamicibacter terrestris]
MMKPYDSLESTTDGVRITIERHTTFDPQQLWEAFTTAPGLAGWIGILRGSAEGSDLTFSMVEDGTEAPPEGVQILRCRAPHELSLSTVGEYGSWNLGWEISGTPGAGLIRFTQDLGPSEDPSSIGPGWEYYLERAIVHLSGGDVTTVQWGQYYPALAPVYTATDH